MSPPQPRSRFFRRCCPPRRARNGEAPDGVASGPKFKLPETPLILAGGLGGPFCICLLTPLRNAITLGSQDAESSAWEIYSNCFRGGLSSGWTGASAPLIPSCPQWIVMGPIFHFLSGLLGTVPAVCMSAMIETFITFGSQSANAQMAYNFEQEQLGSGLQVPLFHTFAPFGPGASAQYLRNIVAMSGIRIFSSPCQKLLKAVVAAIGLQLPAELQKFLGDFAASLMAAVVSAPLNQCYNFAVTSEAYQNEPSMALCLGMFSDFLSRSYLAHGPDGEVLGLSSTLLRDLGMRCAYMATLYTLFGSIERFAVTAWRRYHGKPSDA